MTEQEYRPMEGKECEIVEELLSAFHDKELNDTSDGFVRGHLASCQACMGKLDELQETVLAIHALPTDAVPENDLWPRIVAGAAWSDAAAPLALAYHRPWWKKTSVLIAACLAAVLIPAGAFVTAMALTGTGDEPEPATMPEPGAGFELEGLEETVADALRRVREGAGAAAGGTRADGPGAARLELLLDVLANDESPETRKMAAQGLGEIEDPRAVAALSLALLNDEDPEVRRWAAWALGEIEDAEALPALNRALENDVYSEARRWSAWALGEIEDPRGVPGLGYALLNDQHGETRRWAAWALGEIEDPTGVDALVRALLNDEHAETRRWSAWALGEIESPRGVDPLIQAVLNDEHAETRRWSAWALGEIEDPRAEEALVAAARDEDAEVRRQALWALSQLDDAGS